MSIEKLLQLENLEYSKAKQNYNYHKKKRRFRNKE